MSSYTIKLPQFEGPFDLLLFFIERDELDIYNIPIANITEDFLAYLRLMEAMNIDLASEFILVAATLMRIKSRMLLPRKAVDETGKAIDPREELVERLVDYKRYKAAADELREMETARALCEVRGNVNSDLQAIARHTMADAELQSLTLFRLLKTFDRLVHQYETTSKHPLHTVVQYSYTLEGQRNYLLGIIVGADMIAFEGIFGDCENRLHAIFRFLALLELVQMGEVRVYASGNVNAVYLLPQQTPPADN